MPDRVTTSFIPKESLSSERAVRKPTSGGPFIIINIVATFILVTALLAALGVYVGLIITNRAIEIGNQDLQAKEDLYEIKTINELDSLSRRIKSANTILQNHISASIVLDELELQTKKQIKFNSFSLAKDQAFGSYKVTMSGEGASLNVIAQQAKQFSDSTILVDPIFSGVDKVENGNAVFNFTALIPQSRMTYAEYLQKSNPDAVVPTQETQQ